MLKAYHSHSLQIYLWGMPQGRYPGVGVTEPIFRIVKSHAIYWLSRLYLTRVIAAELRRHLSSMNVIEWI